MSHRRSVVTLTAAALALLALPAVAQDTVQRSLDPTRTLAAWTEARLAAARPLALQGVEAPEADREPIDRALEAGRSWAASPPAKRLPPELATRLFDAALRGDRGAAAPVLEDRDQGGSKAPFSSSQLVVQELDLFYPYLTVGKLFFEIPGIGPVYCSAAVIARRLIVTAAQCVHSGTAFPGFFDDFLFVPAYRDGDAPAGTWPAAAVSVPTIWTTGGGVLPHRADFAIIELQDLGGDRIGDLLGFLGWKTNALKKNHVHMLGYPENLDSGELMHQVTAQIKKFTAANNTATAGSDMRGGAGGGPWIQNFGFRSAGQQVPGGDGAFNLVVGVNSFIQLPTGQKLVGSSMFDANFSGMFTVACNRRAGNC